MPLPKNNAPVDPRPTRADVVDHPQNLPQAPRPGVEAFRKLVLENFGGKDLGIWGDARHQEGRSEHNVGDAWDWGQPSAEAKAELLAWLTTDDDEWARRFGIGYFIADRKMTRIYEPHGTLPYTGADPHTGHVHFSFSRQGAMGQTSGYGYQDNTLV